MQKDIGSCEINADGKIIKLEREYYGQGMIFKSWSAYKDRPTEPCYVPELSDSVYTARDFLEICNNQKEFADELFDGCDWQHPESLQEDWMRNNEWVECSGCGRLVNYGDGSNDTECPDCGTKVNEDE